jgi:hypothetical protein
MICTVLEFDRRAMAQIGREFASDPLFDSLIRTFTTETKATKKFIWEGFYSCCIGDDEGFQLVLSKSHGFMYRQSSNSGFSNTIRGAVSEARDVISLVPDKGSELPYALSRSMIISQTRDDVYLVPVERIHGFCLDFRESNSPISYALSYYFSKGEANALIAKGDLVLPDRFAKYLQLPELVGVITESTTDDERTLATISIGSTSKVAEGMRFVWRPNDPTLEGFLFELEVRSVRTASSTATVRNYLGKNPKLQIGSTVRTSRSPWPWPY